MLLASQECKIEKKKKKSLFNVEEIPVTDQVILPQEEKKQETDRLKSEKSTTRDSSCQFKAQRGKRRIEEKTKLTPGSTKHLSFTPCSFLEVAYSTKCKTKSQRESLQCTTLEISCQVRFCDSRWCHLF